MCKLILHKKLNIKCLWFLLIASFSTSIVKAGDWDEVKKSRDMMAKLKAEEIELRKAADGRILKMRKLALQHLESMYQKYVTASKLAEAKGIEVEINKVRALLGEPEFNASKNVSGIGAGNNVNSRGNKFFRYGVNYSFEEKGHISGSFNFKSNQKVKLTYQYKDKKQTDSFNWVDMGDHVQIQTDSEMETIIVSDMPKSELRSFLIRWGGDLEHKITHANLE